MKCIENHGGTLHSQHRAVSGTFSEIVKKSFSLLQERRTLGAWRWNFKLKDQLSRLQQHQHDQALS